MEKIDKELLIKEISSRLPYGVKAAVCGWDEEKGEVEVQLKIYSINTDGYVYFETNDYDVDCLDVNACRLYLRPLSSMTEEEFVYLMSIRGMNLRSHEVLEMMLEYFSHPNRIAIVNTLGRYSHNIDWLDKNMFDYRGLIERGLAIDCTNLNVY